MVYAGKLGTQKVSLGVSGRLDGREMRNLIMWDEETNSLWNQLKGESVYGKSKGKKLDMLPAIFVGLGTWKQMHPKTMVLDMSTVRAKSWFYTTKDMKHGSTRSRRGGELQIGVGVRNAGKALVVANEKIQKAGVVNTEVGGLPLAIVWVEAHSVPLVYERRVAKKVHEFELKSGLLHVGDFTFDPLTGNHTKGESKLTRFPYIPTYVRAWAGYYPKGKTL